MGTADLLVSLRRHQETAAPSVRELMRSSSAVAEPAAAQHAPPATQTPAHLHRPTGLPLHRISVRTGILRNAAVV